MAIHVTKFFKNMPPWLKGGLYLLGLSLLATILYNFMNLGDGFFANLVNTNDTLKWVAYVLSIVILLFYAMFVALPNMLISLLLSITTVFTEFPISKYITTDVGPLPYLCPPTILGYILTYALVFGIGSLVGKFHAKHDTEVDVKHVFD